MSMSENAKKIIQKNKRKKKIILLCQIGLVLLFFLLWEFLSSKKFINPFIFSSPSKIFTTIMNLIKTGELWSHIFTTLYEIVLAFGIGITLGLIIAILLYELPILAKIIDPF